MASTISESLVIFFRENGHSHDGVGSSPINTNIYSIFDFTTDLSSPFSNSAVQSRRALNQEKFDRYIESIISKNIIEDIDLAQRRIYEPYLYGGPLYGAAGLSNFIMFDHLDTWNGLTFDDPSTVIYTQALHLRTDDMVVENRGGGNTALYARLPSIISGSVPVVQNSNTKQLGVNTSMRELKTDIYPIVDSIDLVKLLNPVRFKWKAEQEVDTLEQFYVGYDNKYGFIVEDVANVANSLITFQYIGNNEENQENEPVSEQDFKPFYYDVNGIVSILTASIKELVKRVEYLESQLP